MDGVGGIAVSCCCGFVFLLIVDFTVVRRSFRPWAALATTSIPCSSSSPANFPISFLYSVVAARPWAVDECQPELRLGPRLRSMTRPDSMMLYSRFSSASSTLAKAVLLFLKAQNYSRGTTMGSELLLQTFSRACVGSVCWHHIRGTAQRGHR